MTSRAPLRGSIPEVTCDLLVVGAGMAGMAAALFAARRGLSTVQVGTTGGIHFASGLIDLLGVHPVAAGRTWSDPWAGLTRLMHDEPRHPYARLGVDTIRAAMAECLAFLNVAGLPYHCRPGRNTRVLTPLGTLKTTYAVPETMAMAERALAARQPCLLVDFEGLKGFSAHQIRAALQDRWPELRTLRLPFPGLTGELQTEHMARRLENPTVRMALARSIRRRMGGARAVGLPAVLGISLATRVFHDLRAALGVPVFEIPTMLPAVTGSRLRECFERQLPQLGVRVYYQKKVFPRPVVDEAGIAAAIGGERPEVLVRARTVILASGRFFGKGLHADRRTIHETIFDLPVYQPAGRAHWHRKNLLHAEGHPIHRAGLAVDAMLRPCDERGLCVHPHLFAAGSVLAFQDWIRQKCGSGLAIASAYAAVGASQAVLGRSAATTF